MSPIFITDKIKAWKDKYFNPDEEIKYDYRLQQNYPNPFNPATTIHYELGKPGNVSIKIYNSLGGEVRELINEFKPAGSFNVIWDGKNNTGSKLSSGIYFYTLSAGKHIETKKMLMIK